MPKGKDYELPNESGRVDPRLPKQTHEMEGLRQAGKKIRGSVAALRKLADDTKRK